MGNLLLLLDKDTLKTVIEAVQTFALFAFIALLVVLFTVGLLVKFFAKEKFKGYLSVALGVLLGFCALLIAIILYLQISRMAVKNEIDANFYLILGFLCLLLIAGITLTILKKIQKNLAFKILAIVFSLIIVAYAVCLIVLLPTVKNEWENYTPNNNVLFIVLSALLVVVIALLSLLFDRKKGEYTTKQLSYAGVCLALSYALSFVKFFSLPLGGSITLVSMLPIMIYAYIFGTKRGVLVGVIYGLLQCLQNPQIYQPLQVLLDYPIAFGALGLAGIFKGCKLLKGKAILELILGMTVACLFRYFSHVLSGYFVFYSWALWEGQELLYSFAYNAFVLVDLAIDVVVGGMIFASKSVKNYVDGIN